MPVKRNPPTGWTPEGGNTRAPEGAERINLMSKYSTETKKSVYEIVTDKIISKLEQGVIPWRRPWNAGYVRPTSWATGKAYRGINRLLLEPGEYLTFNQVQALGGHVKKGEKASIATFYKEYVKEDKNEDGTEEASIIHCLRYYNVFEVSQCEGVNRKNSAEVERYSEDRMIREAENIMSGYFNRKGAPKLEIGSSNNEQAYFSPRGDYVHLPSLVLYKNPEEYYSTAFHEMTHSTGAGSRLNRIFGATFGDTTYAKEELVAELGASMLCNVCQIDNTLDNSAAYIKSWLGHLRNDKKLIITASSAAQKAADYILGVQDND